MVVLTPAQAKKQLSRATELKEEINRKLDDGREIEKREFAKLLRLSRELQSERDKLTEIQSSIDNLVVGIRDLCNRSDIFEDAAEILKARRLREWDTVKNYVDSNYPDNERWLCPTRLGNIAVVHELYPLNRYGISLSAIWPRLTQIIPDGVRAKLDDASNYLDFMILVSLLSLLTTIFSLIVALTPELRALSPLIRINWLFGIEYNPRIFFPILFLLLFWLFYRASIKAAMALGVQIQSTVDLYRLKLLDALDIERPKDAKDELKIWGALLKFICSAEVPGDEIRFKIPVDVNPALMPTPQVPEAMPERLPR
jgi:hypothetical protein